jgi:hypothetical protein
MIQSPPRASHQQGGAALPTMSDPVISLLRDLVAIDSVNPSLVPGAAGEAQVADAVAAHMQRIGLDVRLQEVAPGRPNVIGVLEGVQRGRCLMLCGHLAWPECRLHSIRWNVTAGYTAAARRT